MTTEAEVERLIVRLVGDATAYKQMLKEAENATSQLEGEMRRLGGTEAELKRVTESSASALKQVQDATAKYNWEQRRLQGLLDAGRIGQESYNRQLDKARNTLLPSASALQQYQETMRRGLEVTRSTENSIERYNQKIAELKGLLNSGAISQETYNRALRQADVEMRASAAAANVLSQNLMSVGGTIRSVGVMWSVGITAPITGFLGASTAAAMKMESLKFGLKAVAGSSEEAEKQLVDLREVAKLPGLGLEEAIQGSIRLQAVKLDANLANRAMRGFGNALATVGKGRHELDGVLMAITQIVAKGKVQTEEINQIAERMPQIREAMKQAFGTADTQVLGKMGIKPEQFIEGIVKFFEDELPMMTGGAANTFENFKDTTFRAMVEIGNAVLEILMPALNFASMAIERFASLFIGLPMPVRVAAVAIAALVAAAGPIAVVLGTGVIVAGQLTAAYTALAASATFATTATKALTVASIAAKVAMIGFAVAGIAAILYASYQNLPSIKTLNEEMEKSADLANKLAQREKKAAEDVLQAASQMSGIDKKMFLGAAIEESEKNLKGLEFQLQNTKKNVEDLEPTWLSLGQAGKKAWEAEKARLAEIQQRYTDASQHVVTLKKELENVGKTPDSPIPGINLEALKANESARKLMETMKATAATVGAASKETQIYKLQQQGADATLVYFLRQLDVYNVRLAESIKKKKELEKSITSVVGKLHEQIATTGMSADQIELWKLRQEGASNAALLHVQQLQKLRDAMNLQADIQKMEKSLREQSQTIGMTADQTKLWELRERGASAATLTYVASLQKRSQALTATQGAIDIVRDLQTQIATMGMTTDQVQLYTLAQQGASRSVLNLANALMFQKKSMEDGRQLMEKHKTPAQKFREEYANLKKLFMSKVIDSRTFNEELKLIEKQFEEAQAKANIKVQFTVEGNDAVRAGTEEFNKMLADIDKRNAEAEAFKKVKAAERSMDVNIAAGLPIPSIPAIPKFPPIPSPVPRVASIPTMAKPSMVIKPPRTDSMATETADEKKIKLLDKIAMGVTTLASREPIVFQEANLGGF